MAAINIDISKMPLGSLSKAQVERGFKVLQEIDDALKNRGHPDNLADLSGQFYTIVPHNFGRQRPIPIDSFELLKHKFEMVAMLGDIEIAQGMQGSVGEEDKYDALKSELTLLKPADAVYKKIQQYIKATAGYGSNELLDVWQVDREGEAARYKAHDNLDNRRLLWHGTNVAVVAAVLKTGLRILPTASSGSRLGRGIYLASEHGKSSGYVRPARASNGESHSIMFLCEAAMGQMKIITHNDSSLMAAPPGFDSILARGNTEPDPMADTTIILDGKSVLVPQGKAIATGAASNFSQSEYLIYKESQNRIRYLLRFKM